MADFKLAASLAGHEDDVRAVSFAGPQAVISASRDGTVRYWQQSPSKSDETGKSSFEENIAYHGTAFVNSCNFLSPSQDYPKGLIVSAGKEALIDVRPPGRTPNQDAERLLIGHQGNVCTLEVGEGADGDLMSGSWDGSAMLWDVIKGEPKATFEGHQGSVWAVLPYDRKVVITGAADKLIRVWNTTGKLLQTIKGSTDVVRALCKLPGGQSAAQFASAGNDGVIRLWTLEGREVAQLHGHESFVYSLALLPNGDLVSASEDRTVRIWRGLECIQTITHPAISVWSVAASPETGDIVTGASDRIVRIFTRDPAKAADAETLKAFDDAVKGSAIPQQQMPQINKEKLPGPEFLKNKSGTKEGQVQMIREDNGNITAHQWSSAGNEWVAVGTVVDSASSSGRKQEYRGKDYDYVFDVDIEDGKPPLKLPYNLSDNPYESATKFITDNELPMTYLDEVANFITKNTQGATLGQSSQQPTGADPWGTQNRYRPGDADAISAPLPEPVERPKILPQTQYLYITTANYTQMFKKIWETNTRLSLNPDTKPLALSEQHLSLLPQLAKDLESTINSSNPTSDSPVLNAGVDIATHIVTKYPLADRIPGFDLYRLLSFATPTTVSNGAFLSTLLPSQTLPKPTAQTSGVIANTCMLSLRALVNISSHSAGRELLMTQFDTIWPLCASFIPAPGTARSAPASLSANAQTAVAIFGAEVGKWRNVHIATVTIAINYAVLLNSAEGKAAGANRAVAVSEDLISFLSDAKVIDSETVYRGLVALGTLIQQGSGVLDASGDLRSRIAGVLKRVESAVKEPRLRAVCAEIKVLL